MSRPKREPNPSRKGRDDRTVAQRIGLMRMGIASTTYWLDTAKRQFRRIEEADEKYRVDASRLSPNDVVGYMRIHDETVVSVQQDAVMSLYSFC